MKGFSGKLLLIFTLILVSSVCLAAGGKKQQDKIAIYGDSLCSGYAVEWNETLFKALESRVKKYSENADIMNACRYGDTTRIGMMRLAFFMEVQNPSMVVLVLGHTDMMRKVKPSEVYTNLDYIINELKRRKIKIVLVGIKALPQYVSADYARQFNNIYPELASQHSLTFMPYLLEGVAGRKELTVGDRIHPNAKGNEVIADNMLPYIYAELDGKKR